MHKQNDPCAHGVVWSITLAKDHTSTLASLQFAPSLYGLLYLIESL
jgi:hypothetical protein